MFTLEIDGTAIAITDANGSLAWEIVNSNAFRQDLMAMTSDGTPLWDGRVPMVIRPAPPQETEAFGAPSLDLDGTDGDEDGVFMIFLVPIDHDHEPTSAIPPELRGS
ncbi:hypothetical protein [Microvirga lotononidis]|uniref:Uncharacterized protein n=1 Tax=Microvirga lotononidis TaxID=864069 RepID=I4Z1P6_9HYPH|nr:hypothetical protein [Microvirga lotononidis]EIM30138.1 hypothetical protein MicloDRAFT_00014590 [Microvirga lotononidis]WQO31826.1 hypothetical protein U0023_31245 [Microvirga lotononidis]